MLFYFLYVIYMINKSFDDFINRVKIYSKFDENLNPKNAIIFILTGIIFSFLGGVFGLIIDKSLAKLQKKYKIHNTGLIFLQLFIDVSLIYILFILSKDFSNQFQQSLPGLFFPSMFMGIQSNLFSLIQSYDI